MKIVIQRVSEAMVTVDCAMVGRIKRGLLVFVGITQSDTAEHIPFFVKKLTDTCFFEDDQGKLGKTLKDVGGSILVVSQFTLYGRLEKGRKPDFTQAAAGTVAEPLYTKFVQALKDAEVPVQTGMFGRMMEVSLINDGPVTFILEK